MQPQERRAVPRRQQHKVRVMVHGSISARGGARAVPAWVIDRSRSGLCLEVEGEVKVGAKLTIRPVSAPEKMPGVEVVVKYRRRRDDGFILGCKFIEAPTLVTLLLFG